jgi:uncharacterized protein YdeI (YjbR/CyaY-like superfamily)
MPDRAAWRAWLAEHHATSTGVWLIYYKKGSGKPSISYDDAVEEALCFGWIDSLVHALDAERYMQVYTPRKPKSVWSKLNKARVQKMIEQGLMTPAGLAKIEAAQRNGSWDSLDAIENLEPPADLLEALAANPPAAANFAGFSASARKLIARWVDSAKRPATRQARIETVVQSARENRKPF